MKEKTRKELLKYCSAMISDTLGKGWAMSGDIKSMVPGVKMAGTAYTVRCVSSDYMAIVKGIKEAGVGDVLVIDNQGITEIAMVGEIMVTAAMRNGVVGMVVDGAIRDIEGIRSNGFPIFAKCTIPTSGFGETLGDWDVPVSCGGLIVRPGDWIFGDDDGVSVIPFEKIESTLEGLKEHQKKEETFFSGADFFEFFGLGEKLLEKEQTRKVRIKE